MTISLLIRLCVISGSTATQEYKEKGSGGKAEGDLPGL